MRQVQIGAFLAAMALATLCPAQDVIPNLGAGHEGSVDATQPATAAAAVPIDQTSPRGALKVLAKSMEAGDVVAIKSVLYSANPTEEKMATAMAEMAEAFAKLRTASVTAFGADGAKGLTGDTAAEMSSGMARIDAARESIEGDDAKVTVTDAMPGQPPMVLKRVDGSWKLPISEIAQGVNQATVDERLEEVAIQTKVITEAASEFAAGKYKTPAEAAEGLRGKMLRAAMQRAAATTRPTTEPTTQDVPPPAPVAPGGL